MNKTKFPVEFHFLSPCSLSSRRSLKGFILTVFKREKRAFKRLNIVFCTDNYLLNLNRQFLQHDFFTDILSFPLSEKTLPLDAEIYISVDRVSENTKNMHVSFKEELHRVIFHGVLHFCGYKDKSPLDIKKMRLTEGKYLNLYFKSLRING